MYAYAETTKTTVTAFGGAIAGFVRDYQAGVITFDVWVPVSRY
jgi:hypothetical protein